MASSSSQTQANGHARTSSNSQGVAPKRRSASQHELLRDGAKSQAQTRPLRHSKGNVEGLQQRRAKKTQSGTDSSSRPRAAQQFRVGNVVANGRLQLRPVEQPSNHPLSTPPLTPPSSAGRQTKTTDAEISEDWRGSIFSGSDTATTPVTPRAIFPEEKPRPETPTSRVGRVRSHSFSTIDDVEPEGRQHNNIKVIVEHSSPKRTRTSTDGISGMLGVSIPHYRLGTPHFTGKGSAILHSSIHTASSITGDFPSSVISSTEYDRIFPKPPGLGGLGSTFNRDFASQRYLSPNSALQQRRTASSEVVPIRNQLRSPVDSTVFVELESPFPDQQSRAIVRVHRTTGQVVAATPAGLIAQITSPSLLDYDLLSDFFLTFRAFLSKDDLVTSLVTRLRWAVSRPDDFGRVVRVRTFVALRHWMLNYFVDDFTPDFALRSKFCDLVNNLSVELKSRHDEGGGDLKIVGELKKCWRRTCALYWDIEEHKSECATHDILPGGEMGSRKSSVDETNNGGPSVEQQPPQKGYKSAGAPQFIPPPSSPTCAPQQYDITAAVTMTEKTSDQNLAGRNSGQSAHVVSCSVPLSTPTPKNQIKPTQGPRPVPSASAAAIRANSGQNSPRHRHSRSNSFSDALRDRPSKPEMSSPVPADSSNIYFSALPGSLIRGALFQPGNPYVESVAPSTPAEEKPRFDFGFGQHNAKSPHLNTQQPPNPTVKKFFGSVRRALSTRQNGYHDQSSEPARNSPKPTARSSASRLSRNSSPKGVPKRKLVGGRAQHRIDILAVAAAESFKRAMSGEGERVLDKQVPSEDYTQQTVAPTYVTESDQNYLSIEDPAEEHRLHSQVTMGSREIVIIDDTGDRPDVPELPSPYRAQPDVENEGSVSSQGQVLPFMLDTPIQPGPAPTNEAPPQQPETFFEDETELKEDEHDWTQHEPNDTSHALNDDSEVLGNYNLIVGNEHRTGEHSESDHREPKTHVSVRSVAPSSVGDQISNTDDTRTSTQDAFSLEQHPQLRRRPGGNLRAVDHVHSLASISDGGSRASTVSHSHSASVPSITPATRESAAVEQEKAEMKKKKSVSLLDTHSSQPMLRPSFEKEVAKLAQIPDNDDDGGIEATLRKLEGQFGPIIRQPSFRAHLPKAAQDKLNADDAAAAAAEDGRFDDDGSIVNADIDDGIIDSSVADATTLQNDTEHTSVGRDEALSRTTESQQSYASIPLLARGVSHGPLPRRRRSSSDWLEVSLPQNGSATQIDRADFAIISSQELTSGSEMTLQAPDRETTSKDVKFDSSLQNSTTGESFLLNENQSMDDLPIQGRENEVQSQAGIEMPDSFYDDTSSMGVPFGLESGTPTREIPQNPLSDPMKPSQATSDETKVDSRAKVESKEQKMNKNDPNLRQSQLNDLSKRLIPPDVMGRAHLPFVLAFDSLLLAQQLTLLEKDAMSEINWVELVNLKWKQSPTSNTTWVECLQQNSKGGLYSKLLGGIDVCIARFNIMVKWVVSEIVLCENPTERAACIVKYIHVAQHARSLRNWATMFQITMALVRSDIARLKETWALVPERERGMRDTLEWLVAPTRNFTNLRAEMEASNASTPPPGTNGGCIPFIGIHTHDLIYNAQKPEYIPLPAYYTSANIRNNKPVNSSDEDTTTANLANSAGAREEEKMVNFDRCRTMATIVKNLLRLLDASQKYSFQPVPEVLSRCLWMATLGDEEIGRRSRALEA